MNAAPRTPIFFYGEFTGRLKYGLVVCIFGLVYLPTVAWIFRSLPAFALFMWIGTGIMAFLFVVAIARIVNLKLPILTLREDSFTYRSITVPWNAISDLTTISTGRNNYLGVVLDPSAEQFVDDSLVDKRVHRLAFRASMRRFGALPVPAMKGAGIEDLRRAFDSYRHRKNGE